MPRGRSSAASGRRRCGRKSMPEFEGGRLPGAGEEEAARLTGSLREGLAAVPVPDLSTGFDARVLAAHQQRAPGWSLPRWLSWPALRPVLSGAACSLLVTLALAAWSARLPLDRPARRVVDGSGAVAVERALEGPDLSNATLAGFNTP